MYTLKELKNTIKKGTKIKLLETNTYYLRGDNVNTGYKIKHPYEGVERIVTKTTKNRIYLATQEEFERGVDGSWIDIPKWRYIVLEGAKRFKFLYDHPLENDKWHMHRDYFIYQIVK